MLTPDEGARLGYEALAIFTNRNQETDDQVHNKAVKPKPANGSSLTSKNRASRINKAHRQVRPVMSAASKNDKDL